MKTIIKGSLAILFAAALFTACNKDSNISPDEATINEAAITSSEDVSDAESYSQNTEDESDMAIEGMGSGGPGGSSCAVVTYSAPRGTFPQTITVDFGTGCTDHNGRIRKGKIVIALSDSLMKPNSTKTVTFQNFYVDSAKIEGTRTWKNNGLNAQGQPSFTRTVTNGKITFGDGTIATWNATHTVVKTQGFNTRTPLDDIWTVTGNESGVNRKGKAFSSVINSPIVHKALCPWITSGVRTITIDSKARSLDYGSGGGNCDREALLTLPNGQTKVIKLRR